MENDQLRRDTLQGINNGQARTHKHKIELKRLTFGQPAF
jgi:hypothetical protein